jgi:DNA gyrase subunit A
MGRSTRGVSGMKLDDDDELTGVLRVTEGETMLLLSEYGFGKRVDFSEFSSHGRGTRGQRIYTVSDKTGELAGCVNVLDNEEIMCITSQGKSIKLKVASIRVMGRSAQGVRILSIDRPDFVIGVDRIVKEDDAGEAVVSSDASKAVDESGSAEPENERQRDQGQGELFDGE